MNIFSRIYCRLYQTVFKVFMPFLPYREPAVLMSYDDIIRILDENGYDNVLLVTGKNIRKLGLTENLENALKNNGIEVTVRREMGSDINAACGQLRKSYIESEK